MDTYLKHLSETVLAEDKVVDYRLLSQSLQVPLNTAKQMLYEFHRTQNAKRPGSVHATYLIYGVRYNSSSQDGGDEEMLDADSLTDGVPVYDLCLVTEEKLRDVLAEYEEVKTIHVYSVSPRATKDMGLLADLAQEVNSSEQKVPHTIVNPNVRKRTRKSPGLKIAAAAKPKAKAAPKVKEEPKPVEDKEPVEAKKPAVKNEKPEKTTSAAPAKKPAPAKASGIMAAFSKAASLPKKEPKTSKTASPAITETNTPVLSDEDDEEEEMPQPQPRTKPRFKTKKQIEEGLRRMMEEEDEEEAPASERAESPEEPEPEPMEVEEAAPEPIKEEKEVVETTSNGRRRGKRRIMRKKQIMDEQGYLVTIQEPGWESFSEDEAPPPPKVVKTTNSAPAQGSKAKKPAAKGQGSIMSFFSKKT